MTEKTREDVIKNVWKKMIDLSKNYTYNRYCEIIDIISDWNAEHDEDDEIFMCDDVNENGKRIGVYLEDDYILFKE